MSNDNSHAKHHKQYPTVICIMGPTASGKTALAIETAKALNGEVVSVDSALIYRDMNIGTAKPDVEEMAGIRHWLMDICSPEESYSVADFRKDAIAAIEDIVARGKTPILAGGTMMYFNALVNGISEVPPSEKSMRQHVKSLIEDKGLASVHQMLCEVDAASAAKIHPNDMQRTSRAMEVFLSTGKPLSFWQNKKHAEPPFNFTQFCIMPEDRETLHKRIAKRFEQMLDTGLVDEVRYLLKKYELHLDLPSLRSVGYRQVYAYLTNEYSYEEMRERGVIATRQLAKRQITWLRAWSDVIALRTGDESNLRQVLQKLGA
ncbi:tRNA (adenosine(37)-N6)-dimethylallyltransferase MiaA [Agaribacter flavus]|uniref:tRNA dimethylallyltransferase n=1 Tax=Agaribacter flavus TaxID=1902781 RepID=A0ABV7FRL7_9ALTE